VLNLRKGSTSEIGIINTDGNPRFHLTYGAPGQYLPDDINNSGNFELL